MRIIALPPSRVIIFNVYGAHSPYHIAFLLFSSAHNASRVTSLAITTHAGAAHKHISIKRQHRIRQQRCWRIINLLSASILATMANANMRAGKTRSAHNARHHRGVTA